MRFLFLFSTLLVFSNNAMADVSGPLGCGDSPRPSPKPDTASDTGEEGEGEEGEEAKNQISRTNIALLFLPVIGLAVASRRK
jgi:hypothetical protein